MKSSSENKRELTSKIYELSKSEKRNTEQREIQERIPKLQAEIEELKVAVTNVNKFAISLISKPTCKS